MSAENEDTEGRLARRLNVVPRPVPGERIVLELTERGLQGPGSVDLHCGTCDTRLAAGLPDERIELLRGALVSHALRRGAGRIAGASQPVLLKCPVCGAYNEVR